MVDLILASHGSFAAGIREAAEMILGEQTHLIVLGLYPGDTVDDFSATMEQAIDSFTDAHNILILTDIPRGTPSNTANRMVLKRGVRYLSGCNLPMVLEILSSRGDVPMDELVQLALAACGDGVIDSKVLLERLENRTERG